MSPYSLADFVRFASKLLTEEGKPLRIAKFQQELLRPYFGGTQQTVIVLPTGNGKTTLMAALGLYHFLRVPNAQVLIVASAEDQAATLFKQMRTLSSESAYADLVDVKGGRYAIYHKGDGPNRRPPGEIRVIASEVKRQEGAIPTLVLVDELHAHKDRQMYEMLRDKLWKRAGERGCGRMVAISTAGFTFDSPLWKLTEQVHAEPSFHREGFCNRASTPALEWFEYALDPDQDRRDVGLVAQVNPARWITRAVLRRRLADITLSPGEWARSACNVWTAGLEPEITPEEWDALRADIGVIEDGDTVVLAPSVGHNAVIGVAAVRPGGKVAVRAEHIDATPGRSIMALAEDRIMELCARYDVWQVLGPRYGLTRTMELVEERGGPVEQHPYSTPRQIEATGTFDRYLRSGDLIHDGNPKTRAQVLAVTKKVGQTGEYYMASDQTRAVQAISQAVHAVTAGQPDGDIILPSGVMA